ncbi:MAG: UvrD-helicase domain-containing protein [Prevotella sp.]|nr:UvrD-helicase domain-containing protein [Prevotella sp.]
MEQFFAQLDSSQQEAVRYCDGAQLVIAGAGSGKTRVLTYKIAYLMKMGMAPWNILALTFTNKAAAEMKERIGKLVGLDKARWLNMGTFHSVFSHILRREAAKIGYSSNFTIYDQNDSRSLVKAIIKEMGLDDKAYKPASVADRISMAKNRLLLPSQYAASAETIQYDNQRKMPAIKDIYRRYHERCRQANVMDFDDLLLNTYMLFANDEETRKTYVERFQYVLVDEYQDTNHAQQEIVYQLTKEHQRVCVVGDDAQSIYSFRGANIDNILKFDTLYNDARLFKLEQNYRSTKLIVQAANSLIKHNKEQIPKDVYSNNEHGDLLQLKMAYSDKEESIIVCKDIKKYKRQDRCGYSDFAILYRTNSQSRSFEEALRKENIPYRILGGLSFYQRKEIKDIMAYYRVVINPDDEEALKRIINYPTRGIGDTTLNKIVATASAQGVSLWDVICQPNTTGLDVSKATVTKLGKFRELIDGWRMRAVTEDAYRLGHDIITESGVSRDIYGGREADDLARQENVEEFLSGLQDFVEGRREEGNGDHVLLADFMQEVALLTDIESDGDSTDDEKVTLMTIHSAKGLEFPTVFVVGMEENIFPSPMCCDSMRQLEEERRLLYVAITRAEKHCILTCAQNRYRYGRMEYDTPSRFLKDIDPQLMHVEGMKDGDDNGFGSRYGGSRYGGSSFGGNSFGGSRSPEWMQNPRPVASQFRADPKPRLVPPRVENTSPSPMSRPASLSTRLVSSPSGSAPLPSSSAPLKEGNVIEHQRFGIGTVIKIEGTGENTKATVEFKNTGTKQLLLKFAKYKVVR